MRKHHVILAALGTIAGLASCEPETAVPTEITRTTPELASDVTTVDPSAIPPQGPYEAINLGTLGGPNGSAQGMNNNGDIIGVAQAANGSTHPFLWRNHVMQALDSGGNGFVSAEAINDDAVIAGAGTVGGAAYAMTWIDGTVHALGPLAPFTRVLLNQVGDVAWTGPTPTGPHAFLWHAGSVTDLGTLGGTSSQANRINDAGAVMGTSSVGTQVHIFVWKDGQMRDVLSPMVGSNSFTTTGFNNRGWIIGWARFGTGEASTSVSWLWNGDSLALIPSLPQPDTNVFALALTERGDVYGVDEDPSITHVHPFIYRHGTVALLNQTVSSQQVLAVSNTGVTTGYIYSGISTHAVATDDKNSWDLGVLGGLNYRQSSGFAVDNAGDVVGESTWFGRNVPTLWRRIR